jgi:tryptophan halogenase
MARSILIVGGGSSGWIAAAYLIKALPGAAITLIESAEIPTLSVGESLNPVGRWFNDALGLDERAFMRACDAVFKIGIRFEGFRAPGRHFFHPFGWARLPALFEPAADRAYLATHLCEAGRFDRQAPGNYSYQIDAALYADFLRRWAMDRGVVRRELTVREVVVDAGGAIASVEGHRADLYVDCTGFRSLLLGAALGEPFVPLAAHLANDRAVALSVPYRDRAAELRAYTNCTALSAGWVWDIPLWSRRGVGYVYAGGHLSEAEAEAELRGFLGAERVAALPARHLRIRHGRHRRPWVHNCVAIGLASGFIEPLESTGLSLTQLNVMDLARFIDDPARYAARATAMFDATADFVQAHYVLTDREDTPYWRAVKHETPPTPGLAAVLAGARARDYGVVDRDPDTFYRASNWNVILSGMGLFGAGEGERPAPEEIERVPPLHDYLARHVHAPAAG